MSYSKQDLKDLYDGKLPWPKIKEIMSRPKDDDRFEKYVEILQERLPWKEKILLPIGEHLYIVQKGAERIVKCDCGHEFGDYRRNWKLSALIFVRDTRETLEEILLLPVRFHEARKQDVLQAAQNKMRFALSYADAFAVALTQSLDGTILTGDPEILQLDLSLKIEKLERH